MTARPHTVIFVAIVAVAVIDHSVAVIVCGHKY